MNIIEDLKSEIERAYRVLYPEMAELQNRDDINEWRDTRIIDHETAKILHAYNRSLLRQEMKG